MNNIKCSVSDCVEPVIGQCQGYKEPCGRFYCEKHSNGRFCDECASVIEAEKIYYDYVEKAKSVRQSAKATWTYIGSGILGFYSFGLIFGLLFNGVIINGEASVSFVSMPFGLMIGVLLANRHINKGRNYRLSEMSNNNLNFNEFYISWSKAQKNEMITIALGLGIALAIGTAASAISTDNRIARDVEHIKNRLDIL